MNAEQANKVSIEEYLKRKGIDPKRRYPGYLMYRVPWRNDSRPSLKVDLRKNLWIDYGSGKGGTLIDLIRNMKPNISVKDAIQEINRNSSLFSFHQQPSKEEKVNSGISIIKIKPIGTNPALTNYLRERCIDPETARHYCSEVYYKVNGKSYFGIGHESENGWHIRNKYWKGCTGQGITHFKIDSRQIAVYEGIFDMLSYQQLKINFTKPDILILNSTVNLNGGRKVLKEYARIDLFLDNDQSGDEATRKIRNAFPFSQDKREIYQGFKDLNAFHVSKISDGMKLDNEPEASHVLVRPKRLYR